MLEYGNGGSGEGVRRRRKLSPEDKYQIFLETSRGDVPVAAVLRKWGIYSSDLARIRGQVRRAALEALARGNGKAKEDTRIVQLKGEKARLEEAIKELAIENTLLRKKWTELGRRYPCSEATGGDQARSGARGDGC